MCLGSRLLYPRARFAANHSYVVYVFVYYVMLKRILHNDDPPCRLRNDTRARFAANHSYVVYVFVYYVMLIQYYMTLRLVACVMIPARLSVPVVCGRTHAVSRGPR